MGQKQILIISSAYDESTWSPVANLLRKDGYSTVIYKADQVARGEDPLKIDVRAGKISVSYNGQVIDLRTVAAAWYRRPSLSVNYEPDAMRQETIGREVSALQYSLWREIPARAWLNAPWQMSDMERKITQLKIAQRVGFAVPDTVVTNKWDHILSDLPENILFKSSFGTVGAGSEIKVVYSKPFLNSPKSLPVATNPFPGIWQQQITDKAREWRITVVEDEVFCAAIYTDKSAKDDWRKHQGTSAVQFKHGEFPMELQQKCRQYLRCCKLRFGAFDFIEDSHGKIIFLECNTNGQYAWLEHQLGLGISRAIASSLERIANNHGKNAIKTRTKYS